MPSAFLLAGESSGDLQGALLARALHDRYPDLQLFGVGGERMEEAGVELLFRSDELAVVGLVEVLGVLPRILSALESVRDFLSARRPDVFVPIDFPDFNLRLLPHAWRLGIPITYYISPQVWAWRQGRIGWLKRYVRRMIVIFPFEAEFYREHGVAVRWVGHPLVETAPSDPGERRREARARLGIGPDETVIALLPGSRRSEVTRLAPIFSAAWSSIESDPGSVPAPRPIVGQAPGLSLDVADRLGLGPDTVRADGQEALAAADLAWVASGTATLQAMLVTTPSVVVYRVNRWTYEIARRVIRVPHIAMANLVAGERVLPELVQDGASPEALVAVTRNWLTDPAEVARIQRRLAEAREALGPPGAAGRAAEAVLEVLDR